MVVWKYRTSTYVVISQIPVGNSPNNSLKETLYVSSKKADNAEVVAICDKLSETLEAHRQKAEGRDIALYDNFDDFIQHDMDAVAFGYDRGVIPRMETSTFKGDEKLIQVATDACKVACPDVNVHVGRVLTGDQFISDKKKKDWLVENFDGYCTEMEGAAIAQTAYRNNVPFVILRAISDKADDSAEMDYPTFEKMAARRCAQVTQLLAKKMQENVNNVV